MASYWWPDYSTMTLREAQSLHVQLTSQLISYILSLDFQLTWGETLRTKLDAVAEAASGSGISNSLHLIGLAVDLNLFKDGVWLSDTESHRQFGTYWKSLNPLCRWGGDFSKPDGNHYSITWEGRS
jgi:hypothetical protein